MTTWRALLAEAASSDGLDDIDARRIVERASGWEASDLARHLDDAPTARAVAHFDAMVARRATGEPLQYVVGAWGFRTLDLHVDARVLIPRPETESVVQAAIDAVGARRPLTAVDLGTGSGAIALSLAVELGAEVWATDESADALAVARANVAGRGVTTLRLCEGDWYGALPSDLRGRVDLIVSNPPYVAAGDELPAVVRDWEPVDALVAGPTGLEDIERIVRDAPAWLARRGVLVVELAPHQADAVAQLARDAGFHTVDVRPDLAGRPRALVARVG
ncbi:MAG TPA: peptide chain release factor N(5)-glutamine methyltransferase [Acidimicrobiales bacterium]|nr:peptide chain release factor N(5)-glutamine methyltransferase [Acidimicrobiales bacterium]